MAEIAYGMTDYNYEIVKPLDEGKVKLGGCLVGEKGPTHHCNNYETDF